MKGWERKERITHFCHGPGPVPCDFPRSLPQIPYTNLGLGNWPGLFFVRNLLARPVSGEGRSPQGMANSTRHQPSSHATGTYFPSSRKFANATPRQKTWQHATTSQERLSMKNSCREHSCRQPFHTANPSPSSNHGKPTKPHYTITLVPPCGFFSLCGPT